MTEKPVFTAKQHLESTINATINAYTASPDPAHMVIAGLFVACLERISFHEERIQTLLEQIEALNNENQSLFDKLHGEEEHEK